MRKEKIFPNFCAMAGIFICLFWIYIDIFGDKKLNFDFLIFGFLSIVFGLVELKMVDIMDKIDELYTKQPGR